MDYCKLYEELKKYKINSFDLYDTLIFRCTEKPQDVFEVVQNKVKSIGIHNFTIKRILAEKLARKMSNDDDISIKDIYKFFKGTADEKNTCIQIEKTVEISVSLPNEKNISLVKQLHLEGHKIIVTTDMYLDYDTIRGILEKHAIPFDKIYISGVIKKAKYTGRLFDYILKDLEANEEDIIHVGDNYDSDVLMARKSGINSIHYINDEFSNYSFRKGIFQKKCTLIESYCNITNLKSQNIYNQIGYKVFGPLLYGFCKWLNQNIEDNDAIWFVSREGYLIENVFFNMYEEKKKQCEYVCLNKNTLRFPALYFDNSFEVFLSTIPRTKTISIAQIIKYVQLGVERKINIELKTNIYDEIPVVDAVKIKDFMDDYYSILFSVQGDLRRQTELFLSYINEKLCGKRRIILVNNSMHGNGQALLTSILKQAKIDLDIIGLQFFKSNLCLNKKIDCNSWFDEIEIPGYQKDSFERNCLMFEHILFEPIGTALRFCDEDNKVGVVHKDSTIATKNHKIVKDVHQGVYSFVKNFKRVGIEEYIEDFEYTIPFFEFMIAPTNDYITHINRICDDNDIGGEVSILGIDEGDLMHHTFKLHEFNKSSWKQGYLLACGKSVSISRLFTYILYVKAKIDGR